ARSAEGAPAERGGPVMSFKPRKVSEQVIVITGATSGIGLCTAKMAASRGAKLVLAARNEDDLITACEEARALGGQARYVVADVGDPDAVAAIAETALTSFGRIDTWVNNAGTSIYGRITEVALADMRRLFDTDFWGMVYGSRAAVSAMRDGGGVLINVGSIVSDQALPLQGIYSAAKHAVKGFTDALRMEIDEEGLPVAVSLIKPSAIDTPFIRHAKNYMDVEPKFPPPVYAPEVVATTILSCAERPVREVTVGGGGRIQTAFGTLVPGLTDKIMARTMVSAQRSDLPPRRSDALYSPRPYDGGERGNYRGHVMKSSAFTAARLHPVTALAALTGLGLVAFGSMRALSSRQRPPPRRPAAPLPQRSPLAAPAMPPRPGRRAPRVDPSYVRLADGI
ncbi:MAG TPA: SDR family oxidoreductase, partial [Polyangiaceae bacterium]|nr:SDR family oxidoreductase [Polyangiaceae bacterium]